MAILLETRPAVKPRACRDCDGMGYLFTDYTKTDVRPCHCICDEWADLDAEIAVDAAVEEA